MAKTRMILDVDTGIDDSLALLYAVKSDNIELVGVTTACGNVNVEQATENTLRVLDLAKASPDIPVVKGAARPLAHEYTHEAKHIHGDNGIGGYELPPAVRKASEEDAASFIVRQAHELGKELTLVFVGRLTNLAVALAKDPAIAGLVKGLVIMGGALKVPGNATPVSEANIWGDPEAAHRVFESGIPITMVGLDVTMQTIMNEAHLGRLLRLAPPDSDPTIAFADHILRFYFEAYERFNGYYGSALHDPLAVAVAADPSFVGTEAHYVTIETRGALSAGATLTDLRKVGDKANANASVCVKVDAERFIDHFIEVLAKPRA